MIFPYSPWNFNDFQWAKLTKDIVSLGKDHISENADLLKFKGFNFLFTKIG
ncbi:hypothetical protein P872_05135 [Rhodonellum psychrophilum GCM71 = DSM 17998]|uniref:Uncharacterized protein n=1 Tax=Rhodonellum psychrophilum GCM71 = DSM 17998 TaxID=1123057 RepID=U5BQZ1_9BACT|nr:hypothetical protein P872_05135 [Rhodonellum psychrophilum GCM71 = DSM 17998]